MIRWADRVHDRSARRCRSMIGRNVRRSGHRRLSVCGLLVLWTARLASDGLLASVFRLLLDGSLRPKVGKNVAPLCRSLSNTGNFRLHVVRLGGMPVLRGTGRQWCWVRPQRRSWRRRVQLGKEPIGFLPSCPSCRVSISAAVRKIAPPEIRARGCGWRSVREYGGDFLDGFPAGLDLDRERSRLGLHCCLAT
jgi:hypothetical protein